MTQPGEDIPFGGSIGPEFDGAHDAFERMRRAFIRGTGCHLTAEMIRSLELTVVGGLWTEGDPRQQVPKEQEQQTNHAAICGCPECSGGIPK